MAKFQASEAAVIHSGCIGRLFYTLTEEQNQTYREYVSLPDNHPAVGTPCAICKRLFVGGDTTRLIPASFTDVGSAYPKAMSQNQPAHDEPIGEAMYEIVVEVTLSGTFTLKAKTKEEAILEAQRVYNDKNVIQKIRKSAEVKTLNAVLVLEDDSGVLVIGNVDKM